MAKHGGALKILSCNGNVRLARAIADRLSVDLLDASITRFNDDEIQVEINENVRGEDVFVIQPTSRPANDYLMELLIVIDALARASADRITAVMPYFGYARQDRKTGGRRPITAKLVANLVATAGADRILNLDLHAGQIQGFFDIPVDNLTAEKEFAEDLRARGAPDDVMVISPDVGGTVRARALASRLGTDIAIVDKFRRGPGESEVMGVIGVVEGRACVLVDDIIDTGGTLCNAAAALKEAGATEVSAYITHGVLSKDAIAKVERSELTELVITDSIEQPDAVFGAKRIRQLSMAPLLAAAISRIHNNQSISDLFG